MRRIAWLAVPVVLAGLVADAGGARSGAADRCRPPKSQTVAQTSRVRVYRDLRRRYPTTYACLFSRGRPLALDQPTGSLAHRPVAINGRFVAYVRSSAEEEAAGPSRWSLLVVDASRSRPHAPRLARNVRSVTLDPGGAPPPAVVDLALSERGNVAWSHVHDGKRQVLVPGRLRTSHWIVLDEGPGVEPESLSVCSRSRSACWASGGRRRAVALDPPLSRPRLGTPEVIASVDGEANLLAASSGPRHPEAYAVFHRRVGANVYAVIHRDSAGHAHRFRIPTTRGAHPEGVRLVALEDGGGMALWDERASSRILARAWTRDGTLGPIQVAMSDVATVRSAENDSPQWRVRADGRGTVVVASTGVPPSLGGEVLAAIRDPGGPFGARQELTPPGQPALEHRQILITPVAPDGSVAVGWGPEFGTGPGGWAVRRGREASFGPPEPRTFVPDGPLSPANRTVFADDGAPITVSPGLARLCPCVRPHLFRWGGGARLLAFQTFAAGSRVELGTWRVAWPDVDGIFRRSMLGTRNASSIPVRRTTSGEVGFARFDTNTDYNRFRARSRLVVIPFGDRVPRSRRAPRLGLGTFARATARRLLVPVYCDRSCVVAHVGRLEPFTVGYVRVAISGRKRIHVRVRAVDDARHRSRARATFVRSRRPSLWCRAPRDC